MVCDAEARDARPFLAHHLRERADLRVEANGAQLHALARWVENVSAHDPRMAAIALAAELDYGSGAFHGGHTAEALIDDFRGDDPESRDKWLDEFAVAVQRGTSKS